MRKRIFYHICLLAALLPASSCVREEIGPERPDGPGTVLRLAPEGMFAVETRTAPPHMGEPEGKVEWATVYVFDNESGELLATHGQELDYPDNEVRMLLPEGRTLDLHAVCNAQEWFAEGEITRRDDLLNKIIEVEDPDDVFKGKYMMYGHKPDVTSGDRNTAIVIPVSRLGSHITFDIKFAPENPNDQFFPTNIQAYRLPLRSRLSRADQSDGSEYNRNSGDAVHPTGTLATKQDSLAFLTGNYFDGCLLRMEELEPNRRWTTEFYQFENRRGALEGDRWFNMLPDSDPEKPNRQQIFKARYGDSLFYYATYIDIKGTYVTNGAVAGVEETMDATYRVYLGSSNDRDFNIKRNGHYHYDITIKTCDEIDTRVDSDPRTEPSLTPTFETPLDAHYNTVKCFMFAPDAWELYVENPDKTPWLEISFSPVYKPHRPGEPLTEECATTRIEGETRRLDYFYIHTDEYIPYLDGYVEGNNDHYEESRALRTGTIVLRNRTTGAETRIPIPQRPAQIVRLDRKLAEGVDYRYYYVESILEKKALPWGFEEVIDPPMMVETLNDWWDGFSNTRKLYEAGLNPDEQLAGQVPYYNREKKDWKNDPTVQIPENVALGYALTKNRDRDGNGRIDYDEIVWYIPAADELYELLRVCNRDHYLWYENAGDKFWTSQIYSGGSTALNGRSYYIRTGESYENADDDLKRRASYPFALRERRYNVLCIRLAQENWPGDKDGSIDGGIGLDEGWEGEEEEIMPKK